MEIWKDIDGFEGTYQVSNYGRVKSLDRIVEQPNPQGTGVSRRILKGQIIKPKLTQFGYLEQRLFNRHTGQSKSIRVHQLVARAFISNPENKPQINHIDGEKANNRVENLEWCTAKENIVHANKNGLTTFHFGENHHNTKITADDVRYIRTNHKYRDKEFSADALGRKFKVCTQTILNIVNRKVWDTVD